MRYILGYLFGLSVFGILLPCVLWLMAKSTPQFNLINQINPIWLYVPACLLLIIGSIFMIWSNLALFFIGKGGPAQGFDIAISPPTQKLVIIGPYKYTRNPMVFGTLSVFFAISLFLGSIIDFLLLIAFSFAAKIYIKYGEETRLIKDFGNEYLEYKKSVPMMIPCWQRNKTNP